MNTDDLVKDFLANWRRAKGNFDLKAFCELCGAVIIEGNFALIDGVLFCLSCRDRINEEKKKMAKEVFP